MSGVAIKIQMSGVGTIITPEEKARIRAQEEDERSRQKEAPDDTGATSTEKE